MPILSWQSAMMDNEHPGILECIHLEIKHCVLLIGQVFGQLHILFSGTLHDVLYLSNFSSIIGSHQKLSYNAEQNICLSSSSSITEVH